MLFRADQGVWVRGRRWLWRATVCLALLALPLTGCQFDTGGAYYDVDEGAVDGGTVVTPDGASPDMMPPESDAACAEGACLCALPLIDCGDDGCIDPDTDRKNCGTCGKDCKRDETCYVGDCTPFRVRDACDSCPCDDCGSDEVCDVHHDGSGRIVCIEVD